MTTTKTPKPISAAAAAVLDLLEVGTVLTLPKMPWIEAVIVLEITEKSVKFTNGTFENKRGLGNYKVVA